MKLTNFFLSALLAFSAVPFLALAQPSVSNVTFNQQPDGAGSTQVVVNYDLVSDDAPSTVSLLYSLDAAPFEFATAVSGDVGGGIDTGTDKEILWSVAQDLPSTESTNLVVRVLAEDGLPIELEISATVADGGLTNDPNQTATFTFSEAVTGFTADDVTVTNATKGAFDGSGAVYTLDITADDDGTVSISVPAAAGVSASGSGNTTLGAGPYSFEVDTTAPTLPTVTIASNNANPALAAEGDTITVAITADEDITEPAVTIAGNSATVSGSGISYTATYVVQSSDTEGPVAFSIDGYSDLAGNAGSAISATTDSSSVTIDTTAPTIASIDPANEATITSLDEIVVTLTEEVVNLTAGQLTVNGSAADTVTGTNPYTFSGFNTPALGTVNVSLAAGSTTDLAGNAFAGDTWNYEKEAISLTITSTLAEDSVSETQSQTLTFTFGDNVSGFDGDQVSVTNATKGAFSGSDDVYTLELTGEGGLIEVEVPADFGPQFTDAATFSNFYQDTWTIELQASPQVTMDLIRIPAGTFMMGSPEDELSRSESPGWETQHHVTLTQDFYLGKTQVTQEQWQAIYSSFPQMQDFPGDTMPVHRVSYDDIMEPSTGFMELLNEHITATAQGPATIMLPTEAQWEYAARAGTTTRFSFGDGFHPTDDEECGITTERIEHIWYCGNSPSMTEIVGQKAPNPWGLYDMHGNVWEWCSGWFGDHPTGPVTDPTGPSSGILRVVRGGSWYDPVSDSRSARRLFSASEGRSFIIGLRVLAVRPMPLTITSSVTESVHQTETQTLTFTFKSPVSDFTADDVELTGATKGTFTEVSPSVYTLEITGTGGTVIADVPANAATENTSTWVGTSAASFSNFYQDTWTIELQESPLVTMDLIRIPAGEFTMGSPETELSHRPNEAQHEVTISQDFYLGKTQVTQAQWLAIYGSFPMDQAHGTDDNLAVHRVSHDDIMEPTTGFMELLNDHITATSQGPATASLPTEAQWEYACRAGTTTRFNFGDGLHPNDDEECGITTERTENMWYCGNSGGSTQLVGLKPANAWGLHDMHGNLWEWCTDWFGTYPTGPVTDPTGPASGSFRVYRGGSWFDNTYHSRSARRAGTQPTSRALSFGFRVLAVRPMPLSITSSETESFHQTENQTLTFTFDGPVSDFTADDVSLTGATKGTFTEVSPSVYTLEITGAGGTIDVSVAPTSPATAPATFSNFYQDTWTIELQESPQVTMDLIRIPAGTFTMGSPVGELSRNSDETQHEVTISLDFYLGKTQVTQAQWSALQSFPEAQTYPGDNRPVHRVSWNDVQSWLTALNTHITEPGSFSLPTESQWEYAARAGTTTRFNFGDGLSTNENCTTGGGREDNMWYCGNNSPGGTKLVGQKPANVWGLHDMHGNVWEWCADWFGTYPTGPVTDPTGPATGSFRVIRGGSWGNQAHFCRSARRDGIGPLLLSDAVGFRVLAVR